MSDHSNDDDDDFVNRPSFSKANTPETPSTSSKRKLATPTSSKAKAPKKKKVDDDDDEDDAKEEELPTFKYLKLDSDDEDDEEELVSKNEWRMVEGATRYLRGQPTSLPERGYVNRKIDLREDKTDIVWWQISKAMNTNKKMSDKSEGKKNYLEFHSIMKSTIYDMVCSCF
ncbi:hypothetical protein Fcan01_02875 [Folsomia candida]|uniref:Uncharacterized protein n=1 Tax=Folsomia candida TaxID=158441 RepID=A0A226EXS5_FOLCA|nr:hypothetical protein Fcan01_02875 [Folsomia candida]